jgi:hypothetical protein
VAIPPAGLIQLARVCCARQIRQKQEFSPKRTAPEAMFIVSLTNNAFTN